RHRRGTHLGAAGLRQGGRGVAELKAAGGVPGGLAVAEPADHGSRAATWPMTATAGAPIPADVASSAALARVVRTSRWLGRLASATRAHGVAASMPAPRSASVIAGSVRTPISTTSVVPDRA